MIRSHNEHNNMRISQAQEKMIQLRDVGNKMYEVAAGVTQETFFL